MAHEALLWTWKTNLQQNSGPWSSPDLTDTVETAVRSADAGTGSGPVSNTLEGSASLARAALRRSVFEGASNADVTAAKTRRLSHSERRTRGARPDTDDTRAVGFSPGRRGARSYCIGGLAEQTP